MNPDERGTVSTSPLGRHLLRGAVGFGLIGAALVLTRSVGPVALLLAPAGLIALRGCPACWTAGLIERLSAGRLGRSCEGSGCASSTQRTN
jgi:hypothetical protein